MQEFITVMKKYAVFTGRARRREYWMFALVYTVLFVLLSVIDGLLGMGSMLGGMGLLSGIFSLACLCPSLAVTVRRLHDIGRGGVWLLLILVPLVGAIVLLVFAVKPGDSGPNQYGEDPKQ